MHHRILKYSRRAEGYSDLSNKVRITLGRERLKRFVPLFETEKESTIDSIVSTKKDGVCSIKGFTSVKNKPVAELETVRSSENPYWKTITYSVDTFFREDIDSITLSDKCEALISESDPAWYRAEVENRSKTSFEPSVKRAPMKRTDISKHQESLLHDFGVQDLFHITHIDNLPTIFEKGLLSHNLAYKRTQPTDISDLEVNNRRNITEPIYRMPLHDYVPLYFNPRNPMLSKKRRMDSDLAIVVLDRTLILDKGVVFTDGNAASEYTEFLSKLDDLTKIDWKCMWAEYWDDYASGKRKRCAEVLIPNQIPIDRIAGVLVKDYDSYADVAKSVTEKVRFQCEGSLFKW